MGVKVIRVGNPKFVIPSLYAQTMEGKLKKLAEEEGKATTYRCIKSNLILNICTILFFLRIFL